VGARFQPFDSTPGGEHVEGRLLLLTEGQLNIYDAKMAVALIRYRREEAVAVLDSTQAGEPLEEIIGIGRGIPIVATVAEGLRYKPTALVIGIAPAGGGLPGAWRATIREAIEAGLGIISGLHTFLGDDPEFASLAERHGVEIWDVRRVPEDIPVASLKAAQVSALRVLTVGSDCCSGKMVTAIELTRGARERGWDAEFAATGQIGIVVGGSGLVIDRVIADFCAGACEQLVLERGHRQVLFIEGQGSLIHPSYSGVTLSLLHGTAPQALILCHEVGRDIIQEHTLPIPSLPELVELHEGFARPIFPSRVVGLSLMCYNFAEAEARAAIAEAERETGLPATDPVRFGVAKLLDRLEMLL
jgi:uncharacterized NAD-dependent epimerase/dehydratase family protein